MDILCKILVRRNIILSYNKKFLTRSIMTTPVLKAKLEQAEDDLKTNPYYSKYADKIAKLQHTSPEEFLSRIETRQAEKQKPKFSPSSSSDRKYSSLLNPKHSLDQSSATQLTDEPLDKIMKVELIANKDADNITKIWLDYHLDKDYIAAAIPADKYDKIVETASQYPTFLFPVPRSQGYEFVVCQFSRNTAHFTPLLNYQVHKENAPECLTLIHYTEFKDSKGIVLMRGEFDKNVLNCQEAQCLANQVQLYYSQADENKKRLLEQFTEKPDEFKHMNLIKEIETLSLS